MVYILNLNLKSSSKTLYSLTKFYGLGNNLVHIMLNDLNIGFDSRIKDLNQEDIIRVIKWVEKNKVIIENNLKQKVFFDVAKQKSLKTYRGLRHVYGLPVRGQRTKTNATKNSNLNANKIKGL